MMKRLIAVLLGLVLALSFAACGAKEEPANQATSEPASAPAAATTSMPAPVPAGEKLETSRWSFTYDPDVWVLDEDDPEDNDYYTRLTMRIPDPADEDDYLVWFDINATVEDHSGFRYNLNNYDFDMYEYAVNNAYETVNIGGLDFLFTGDEDNMTYFTRVEGAGVSVEVEVDGDISNADAVAVVESLQFTLDDIGNVDAPWPWDGAPYAAEPGEKEVGGFTMKTEQIPFAEPIVTLDTFDHNIAVSGETVYVLSSGAASAYSFDGNSLTYVKDVDLGDEYEFVDAADDGTFWFSKLVTPLINWDGEAIVASYDRTNAVAMHPSGEWGVEWGYSNPIKKFTVSGDALSYEEITLAELKNFMHLCVDEKGNIFACGTAADDSGHKVFVYDKKGNLKATLAEEDGSGLGSVTFATQTKNGYLLLDGNMRWLLLYDKDGGYLGQCTFNELFGTDYPWPCDACVLEDGSILALMTDERQDGSADEVIVFRLSGF